MIERFGKRLLGLKERFDVSTITALTGLPSDVVKEAIKRGKKRTESDKIIAVNIRGMNGEQENTNR